MTATTTPDTRAAAAAERTLRLVDRLAQRARELAAQPEQRHTLIEVHHRLRCIASDLNLALSTSAGGPAGEAR